MDNPWTPCTFTTKFLILQWIKLQEAISLFFRKLQNFVELDGYYLESDPCVICNYPEETFNVRALEKFVTEKAYQSCILSL